MIYDEKEELDDLRREIEHRFEESLKDPAWAQGFENRSKKDWWIALVMDNERLSRRHKEMYSMMTESQYNERTSINQFGEALRSSNEKTFIIGILAFVIGFAVALIVF